MLGLLKIYVLFNLHFILIKCLIPGATNLSVRILDKEMIEKKRQDTREMCRIFNSESLKRLFPTESTVNNKYKRRQELKEKLELIKQKKKEHRRSKRASGTLYPSQQLNPALKLEDEQRVEKIVDKIYDDLLEKGQQIKYKRKELPKVETNGKILLTNKTGRRFPFAPAMIEGPTSTTAPMNLSTELGTNKLARFRHAIVPYFIDSKTYDTHLTDIIMKAFKYFEKATCVRLERLRERPTDSQSLQNVLWLYITNPSGIRQCVHSNERAEIKGVQMIVFGYDCMSLGDIMHEIMHVLGFSHEHVRPDRDQYVTILWENIKPGYRKYFETRDNAMFEDIPYDYASVLHYPSRAFSRNGQITILSKPGFQIGQREGLSEIDVEKVGMIYSNECFKRNSEYLLKTCPSVVKSDTSLIRATQEEIEDYFEDRLWPFGVVNYMLKDKMEFSAEELENIQIVISHIEKETCIEFRDLTGSSINGQLKDYDTNQSDESTNENESIEKYVQLGLGPNETTPTLPDFSSSEESQPDVVHINEINDNPARKGTKAKGSKVMKKKKKRNARRMGATPPTPSRRHVSNFLTLTRSPLPGCYCPNPGKPEGTYIYRCSNSLKIAHVLVCFFVEISTKTFFQTLKINADCFNTVNDLLHLFVHVLGLDHQHNMHDRDSYLHIVWDQLTEDIKNEMKRKLPPAASVGFPYDYQSVMHYPWLQIKNGRTNIMYPIWNDGWAMGHWQGLSSTDVQKLNLLYFKQCMERKQQAQQSENKEHEKKSNDSDR